MVLDLLKQLIPWAILLLILFFIWLIGINRRRLRRIKHSGRISEIIDRRRNIVFFIIIIAILLVGLVIDVFTK